MKLGEIVINQYGKIVITPKDGDVWLPGYEIARFFDVFVPKVSSNIKSILKNKILDDQVVFKIHPLSNGSGIELYNLTMMAALAFRINTPQAKIFRDWILKKAIDPALKINVPVYFKLSGDTLN